MIINIDDSAGFCWGVVRTIDIVESELDNSQERDVYVLGEIIHNPAEIERLEAKGMKTISHQDLHKIDPKNSEVIIRAHGEPPKTFRTADKLLLNIVDATCPLVQTLQKRVKKYYDDGWQIVVFGQKEHAEVIGIRGVCNDKCIVIHSSEEAIQNIDFSKKTVLFSQTTMDKPTFFKIQQAIEEKFTQINGFNNITDIFLAKDTICKYVSGREEHLKLFAAANDVILFVAGKRSSNGKSLYNVCSSINQRTYFIEDVSEIDRQWFSKVNTIGITGATSTPQWYMEYVREKVHSLIK